jgi:phenylacetate-CoA ligase
VNEEVFPNRQFLADHQLEKLNTLLAAIVPANRFYTAKLKAAGCAGPLPDLDTFTAQFPFTTKPELARDQALRPPYGTNLTYSLDRYTRCHQTSGTAGAPLRWLDTPESWDWMLRNWEQVLRSAGVTAQDRVLCAFSFGPFIGFWLAFEAACRMGCMTLPGGGLGSVARLRLMLDHSVTVLCSTPTYAIRLAEVAAAEEIDLSASKLKHILVAGEPGGSISATRKKIEELWLGARIFDHHGMTEVGPVTFECSHCPGVLHVMETGYLPEIIDPDSGKPVERGRAGELVLSTLGRTGSPLLRYRTGDLVRAASAPVCACGRSDLALEGGILGRNDDMVVVRGVNVYPSAVEDIIRNCGGVAEYQAQVNRDQALTELKLVVEPEPGLTDSSELVRKLERAFQTVLSLRVEVSSAPPGTLPRFEMKAGRWRKNF